MKTWLIAKSNMKKKKSNVVVLFLLIMIATILLYSSINIVKNVGSFLDDKNESVNGAHLDIITSKGFDKEISDIIKSIKQYDDYIKTDTLIPTVDTKIDNTDIKGDDETMPVCLNVYDPEHKDRICNYKIIDEGKEWTEDSIILPYYLKTVKSYKTGENFEITIDKQKEKFKIYGFIENVMISSPSNISMYECFIEKNRFNGIKDMDGLSFMDRFRVRLTDMNKSGDASNYFLSEINKNVDSEQFILYMEIFYNNMKTGASLFISILMAILAIFAVLIIAVALIVIRFSLNMYIESNLPNIGILESMGYTSSQLRMASVVEYVIISIVSIVAGLLTAFGISEKIVVVVSNSVGIKWEQKIDTVVIVISVAAILSVVLIIALLTSAKIKKITPLDALRNGIHTHNFSKNHLPLLKSRLGVNSSIGIKSMLRQKRQSISIALIIALVVFSGVTVFTLYYNFVVEQDALINLVGLEKPDIMIKAKNNDNYGKIDFVKKCEKLREDKNVKYAMTYTVSSMIIKNKDKSMNIATEIYEKPDKVGLDTLISGREVKNDNEIIISNLVAEKMGVKKGDTVIIECNKQEKSYVIVGITQRISNLGISMVMSQEGAERVNSKIIPDTAYIYLKDASDIKGEIERIKKEMKDEDEISYTNFDEIYENILSSFTGALNILCVVFVIVTIVVIFLIILLVIKMKIVREKRNMGVFKALGFTTMQIIWQNVMSFAPVISVGSLIGVIVGKMAVNKGCTMTLSLCGIAKANLSIPLFIIIGLFAATTVIAFVMCILVSTGVRKIEPYKMITEQ